PHSPSLSLQVAMNGLIDRLEENHAQFPYTRLKHSSRYCAVSCPASSVDQPASPTTFRSSHEDIDPRYFWGDSSDEDDIPCSISAIFNLDDVQVDSSNVCLGSTDERMCLDTCAIIPDSTGSEHSFDSLPTTSITLDDSSLPS
ncbi:unnamed protein product, partial [Dicrocoelium dendriticum]